MSTSVTSMPAISRSSTQSKPFSLGLRAQPGAPSTGLPRYLPTTIRLPGSTGMPARMTSPPASRIAAGIDIVGIAHRRRPEHHDHVVVAAQARSAPRRRRPRHASVRRSAVTRLPERASRASVTLTVLASTLSLTPGSTVWIEPDLQRPERLDGEGLAPGAKRSDRIDQRRLDGKRNDLDRRHHLAGLDRRIFGDGGDGDCRIDAVDRVDQRPVDRENAGGPGMQIDAAGRRRLDLDAVDPQACGDARRGVVLAEIVAGRGPPQ